jgi:hypothetical protein
MRSWLLLSYALLGTGVWVQNGTYTPVAIILVIASFVCLLMGVHGREMKMQPVTIMWAALFLFGVLGVLKSPGTDIEATWFNGPTQIFFGIVSVLSAAGFWLRSRGKDMSVLMWMLFATIVGAVLLRILLLWASPSPQIDVWTGAQESAAHLLSGSNPYTTPITDPYRGRMAGVFPTAVAYMYLPVNLLLQLPAFIFMHDVRAMHIVADIIFALVLWQFGGGKKRGSDALLLPALWFLHPRGMHLIEQGWTEPMLIAIFALSLLLLSKKRNVPGAVLLGLGIGMKQYLLPALLLLPRLRLSKIAIAFGCITLLLPFFAFLLWDPIAFIQNGVLFLLQTFFRTDSLSISSPLYVMTGIMLPKATSAIIVFLASGWALLKFKHVPQEHGYALGIVFSLFAAFLLGSQAFENYYAVVAGFLLIAIVTAKKEIAS